MKKVILIVIVSLLLINTNGQNVVSSNEKVYKLNYKTELPFTLGMFGFNFLGFSQLGKKETLDSSQILSLNINDVWSFDRPALTQSYPAP